MRKMGKTKLHKITIAFLLTFFVGIFAAKASHMAGADLTYQYIGNNQYVVTYSFYRDCSGISAPTSENLTLSSSACSMSQSFTLNPVPNTGQEISLNCPGVSSTCAGGSAPGIQQWIYQTTVTIPAQCPDWAFVVTDCCRNAAITTLTNPGGENLYIEAYLNNTVTNNNSPTFSNVPIAYECIGQNNYYNHGVIDADGDSLVYSFIAPRTAINTPVIYAPGFSIASPLTSAPGVTINSQTGDIFIRPTAVEVSVVAVMVLEYRNGVLIGSVMRDLQIYTTNCLNTLPAISGINNTNSFATSSCGGQICFDIVSTDNDPTQSLVMTWNDGIPNGTISTTGGPRPVGTFCWTPTPTDARPQPYSFTVTIRDNACPSNGVQTYSYQITVGAMIVNVTSSPSVACHGDLTGSATATATGTGPFTYLWNPGGLTGSVVNNLGAGNYSVTITDATGCSGTRNFAITQPSALSATASSTTSTCTTPGTATAVGAGGTMPYSYSWNSLPSQSTQTAVNLNSGTYTVTITDQHQCSATASATVQSTAPVSFSISSTPATCQANDGSVTVTAIGGSGNYSYIWTPNVSSSSSATGLFTGAYSVIVTDNVSGCSQTLNTIVANGAGVSATVISTTNTTCENGEDGSATVQGNGGTPPYRYLWPNGDTTFTTTNLAAGMYVVRVEDYVGCRAYASFTIGYNSPSPVVNLGNDTTACLGTTLTLNAGAGFASYLWNDNSTGQFLTVTSSGIYSVQVANSAGCENFDAINVNFITCNLPHNPTIQISRGDVSSISIFPNPAKDVVNISVSKFGQTEIKISISDILGNQLYLSKEAATYNYNKVIDIRGFSTGIYLVKVEYDGKVNINRIVKN